MADNLSELKPHFLWKHFAEFLKIPHCSGNEKALGDYIVSVAERLQLEWKRDDVGNIVISKKASPGKENAEGVILQGHLDMVCEKNSDVEFDFMKDPIQAEIKGEWVQAKGTTLGSDNAIGECAALAILEDDTLVHPPLECLFTVEEETGLVGANKIQPGFLKGRKLLNLDSEDEGEFTIGCAGGADTQIFLPLTRETANGDARFKLKLNGLQGGHSGVDIKLGRGNAIKLLARILWQTGKEIPFKLIQMEGGNLRNAIPREAWAEIALSQADEENFRTAVQNAYEKIKDEYKGIDPDVNISLEQAQDSSGDPLISQSKNTLINLLCTIPHGVVTMNPEIEGLVETSTNLAVLHSPENQAQIICSTRSSAASALDATRNIFEAIVQLAGAEVSLDEGYPGWKPNLQSPLLKTLKEVYIQTFGEEPQVAAIHAGLECGIIGERFPGMDMISFGPTIKFPHSPSEKVHIGSIEKFWKFLLNLLAEL